MADESEAALIRREMETQRASLGKQLDTLDNKIVRTIDEAGEATAETAGTRMGNYIVEAREILMRFVGEMQQALDSLVAERERLQARVQELTDQLEMEQQARRKEEELVEAYRRDYQKLYVKAYPPTQEDIEFWRNAKREDFNMSWDEVEAMLKEFESQQ